MSRSEMNRRNRGPAAPATVPRFAGSGAAWRTGLDSLGSPRSFLFLGCLLAQATTVVITWPLWQLRSAPPHLPAIDLPQFPMGWWMLASLAFAAWMPSRGLLAHAAVLLVAAIQDQMRLQPQFFALVILMAACVFPWAERFCRWFLASTWFWAGLHKLLSPDWFGHAAWWMVARTGLDPESVYLPFALAVGMGELVLGLAACFRPQWAAWLCVALHTGIVITLSPLGANWNESVIPWNLATAAVGWWVMHEAAQRQRRWRWEPAVAVVMMVYPIGFYGGWIDHGFAGVLYSDCLPRGRITDRQGTTDIRGWGELAVPFPNERRLLRLYFEQSAQPGDKLHISDPRPWLDDQFLVLDRTGEAHAIDADHFFAIREGEVFGVGVDRRRSVFALTRAGVRLLKEHDQGPIYAVAFTPENFAPEQLEYLEGLPNLQQVQLAGTRVGDKELQHLRQLRMLSGVELRDTRVTAAGLRQLEELPYLQYVGWEGESQQKP